MAFAVAGAAGATAVGGAIGTALGTRDVPGRRWLLALSAVPIIVPPAFWWIGATRLTAAWGNPQGAPPAAVVAGFALSPVTLLLVFAALREMPTNLYQAARVALPPWRRRRAVLLPLLRAPLTAGFLLTVILLLGESELPFLFGFRTVMTDVVTTFAQTFDVAKTAPLVAPLLLAILVVGVLAGRPLTKTMLTSSRGARGVVRTPASALLTLGGSIPAILMFLPLAGYVGAALATGGGGASPTIALRTIVMSIVEPVGCAWGALLLTVITVYPVRRSRAIVGFLWLSLLLFCVPAAIYALGWIGVGQRLDAISIPPAMAHLSRGVAVALLGFSVGYARVPRSLEDAAALAWAATGRQAYLIVLPLMVGSLAATCALIAALTYGDRDVASLLLPPGGSRLTLDLYLASANAPAAVVGVLALTVLGGATVAVALAAAGPAALWRRRG
jgi:iron(III) transport system permease protein